MWDAKGSIIQVEIGSGVVDHYSSKGFLGGSKYDAKFLIDEFKAVRQRLQNENIYVPYIQSRDNDNLGKHEFVVYAAFEFYRTNIQESNVGNVIEFFARRYQMNSPSKDTIHAYISMANDCISQRKYTDGLRYLNTAYFWSNLLEDCDEEAADTIIQIGRILVQSNHLSQAQLCAMRADFITSSQSFYNPYLKSASDEFSGFLHMVEENFPSADQSYTSAFNQIAQLSDANLLKIGILAANIQALQLYGNYVKANQAAQLLIDVLAQSGCTNLIPMYQFKDFIANCAIERLKTENNYLREQVQLLTAKYNEVMKKLRFSEQFSGIIVGFLQWGALNLPAISGSLTAPSGGNGPCTKINNINIGVSNEISMQITN